MRVQLPTQISLTKTVIVAAALLCVQQFEHTDFIFSLLFFAFLVLSVVAFNVAGGFSRAAGAYVFFFSLLVVDLGVVWKAVLGEPGNSNLLVPQLDMLCYTVSMVMLLVVILAQDRLFPRPSGIAPVEPDYNLASLGCLALAVAQIILNSFFEARPGSVLSIINQLGQFFPLAIILSTIAAVRDSGGRRSVNFVSGLSIFLTFAIGTLGFSKQGMFVPMVCWLLGVLYARLNLRVVHYIVMVVFAAFALQIAPLLAEGRDYVGENRSYAENARVIVYILANLQEARAQEDESLQHQVETLGKSGYFNTPQGLIERLCMMAPDDAFFNYSSKGNFSGYRTVIENYENLIPHIILADKPIPINGNYYAHQIGGFLAAADDSTGISFSPVPEAYHVDGWTGIFLLLPAIWLSLFASIDFICGDFRRTPWGLLIVVGFAHLAPESLLGGLIWVSGYGNLGLIVAIVFCTRLTPVVGALFAGNNRFSERAFRNLDLSGEGVKPLTAPLLKNPGAWLR